MSTLSTSTSSSSSSASAAPDDDILRASFRGRLLRGKTLPLPSDYQGTTDLHCARAFATACSLDVWTQLGLHWLWCLRAGAAGGNRARRRRREAVARQYVVSHLHRSSDGAACIKHCHADVLVCSSLTIAYRWPVLRVDLLESRHAPVSIRSAAAVDGLAPPFSTGT
jgi:hypothetical protein